MNRLFIIVSIVLSITCATSSYESIPSNYDLVSIEWPSSKLHKRSTHRTVPISLEYDNTKINLNLKPVDDIIINPNTPVYNIERVYSQLKLKTNKLYNDIKMEIYEDKKNFASVVVNIYPNGLKAIENAIIGSYNLIIRPATEAVLSKLGRNHTRHDARHLYVVYSRQPASGRFSNPLERTINMVNKRYPLNIPAVIYPEVLIIVDYYLAKNSAGNSIVPYILAFWNQVDLMYRSLNSPKYRLNIAGIVIPKNPEAVDYISSVRAQSRSNHLYFETVLLQCFKWLYIHQKKIPINSYDVAITMTSTKSESEINLFGLLNGQEIGLAKLSGACHVDHVSKNVAKAGMILDNGDFSGVATAAHELGHILGAEHDDNPVCSQGYLMSPFLSQTIHRFEWSMCSLHYFKNFLETNPKCLFNKPTW